MAQLISTTMLLSQHQIRLVFMDIFGKDQEVYVTLGSGPSPEEKTASMLASMNAQEATIKAWAAAQTPAIDLTESLATGAAMIAAALAAAPTVTTTSTVVATPSTTSEATA